MKTNTMKQQQNFTPLLKVSLLALLLAFTACSSDDTNTSEDTSEEETTDESTIDTNSYILVADTNSQGAYIINHDGDQLCLG